MPTDGDELRYTQTGPRENGRTRCTLETRARRPRCEGVSAASTTNKRTHCTSSINSIDTIYSRHAFCVPRASFVRGKRLRDGRAGSCTHNANAVGDRSSDPFGTTRSLSRFCHRAVCRGNGADTRTIMWVKWSAPPVGYGRDILFLLTTLRTWFGLLLCTFFTVIFVNS